MTTIYITHDLGVVANVADRIAVMYAGDIVEVGTSEEVFFDPQASVYMGAYVKPSAAWRKGS